MKNNEKNDSLFIITSDLQQKEHLKKLGFQEIPSGSSFFIFINNNNLSFNTNIDLKKVKFSNKLFV